MCRHRRWQVYRFGPQNQGGDKFADLGLKTGGVCGAIGWQRWRTHGGYREACIETKRSREGGVSIRWLSKNLYSFTPERYLSCMFNEGRFGHCPVNL